MKEIISPQNQEIKDVAALVHAKARRTQGRFIAEGLRVVSTMLHAGFKPLALYATEKMVDASLQLTDDALITMVSDQVMNKISQATTPSGILGVFKIPEPLAPHTLTAGLVLANVADPGNMGTLIRSCAAMNVKSVVIVEGADPYNPKVVQASAGTLGLVKIFCWNWHELLEYKNKLKLYALIVSGGKQPSSIDYTHALLVVGSEAHGIPEQWIADCDDAITIPMPGNTESLNAAVAGSIALYEVFGKTK